MPFRSRALAAAVLAVLPAAAGSSGAGAASATDPLTCSGYAEQRVFLESQGWWTEPGRNVDAQSEHIHVGACFPHGQSVRGELVLDVRVLLHNMNGRLTFVRAAIGSKVVTQIPLALDVRGEHESWHRLVVNTAAWPRDGRQELRLTANVKRTDGKRQYQSTGWQVHFANGNPVRHYRPRDFAIGRGWYTGFGYANATLEPPLPAATVTGVWRPTVSFTKRGYLATIDPDFHRGSRGTVVAEGTGRAPKTLEIDTSTLAPGPHKLVLRSDDVRAKGTNSGVLVVPFVVAR